MPTYTTSISSEWPQDKQKYSSVDEGLAAPPPPLRSMAGDRPAGAPGTASIATPAPYGTQTCLPGLMLLLWMMMMMMIIRVVVVGGMMIAKAITKCVTGMMTMNLRWR